MLNAVLTRLGCVAIAAATILAAGNTLATTDPVALIPREVLFGNPVKAAPQISPDGTMLAYLAPSNGVLNVWVRTLGKEDDRVITTDKKRGIRTYFWRGNSKHILYLQDQDGDENNHVYMTDLETTQTRDMTPFQGAKAEIVDVNWNMPDTMLVGLNLKDRRLHDVYRVNLKNGAVDLDTENPGDVSSWGTDNKMVVRTAEVLLPDGSTEIRARSNAKSPWKVFTSWGPDETFGGVAGFTPNNRSIWLSSSVGANASRLLEVDLATSKTKVIAEDPQYDIGGLLTNPKTNALEGYNFLRARREWTILDKKIQPDFEYLKTVRDGDIGFNRCLDDTMWVVSYVVDNAPVSYYLFGRAAKSAVYLFSNRPELEKYTLAKVQPISFKSRDGLEIHGYLTLPPDKDPKNLPMVLNVHGGPWGRDSWGLDNETQWLANRGYAVLQVNFRGSTGYGKAHLNAGDREWGAKMHDDLIDAKNWAVKEGYADPRKVVVYGGSYGGYAALVGVTFTPDEFAGGIAVVGPSNLVTLIKSIPPYWAPMRAMFDKRVGKVETEEEFLKSRSPITKVDQIKVPLLIAQGANDPRVKQAEADQIVDAMRKKNIPVTYLLFPDEGHGFARPENRLKFYAAAEEFLAKVLGGRAEPPSAKENFDSLKK
ncbi:MAG: S9 family peptidase [Candidatus Sumerlaeaceae bacterium]|nr:S9 family peptidase [Candidatus Sumerlaeaceae bacterium]